MKMWHGKMWHNFAGVEMRYVKWDIVVEFCIRLAVDALCYFCNIIIINIIIIDIFIVA